jgi:hypothetical protein
MPGLVYVASVELRRGSREREQNQRISHDVRRRKEPIDMEHNDALM